MLELLGLFGLLIVGLAAFAVLGLLFGLLKLSFKLLLLPLSLAWGLAKCLLICCLVLLALCLAPAILALLVVAVPVVLVALLLTGLVGVGWAVVAA